jgi:hypothetical protein
MSHRNGGFLALGFAAAALAFQPVARADEPSVKAKIEEPATKSATYKITHSLKIKDIPAGSKNVRVWFWFPDDDPQQKLLEFKVPLAPAGFQLTRDAANGHRYLFAETENPGATLSLVTEFTLSRKSVHVPLDAAKAGPITEAHRQLFREYLRTDCPNMMVDNVIKAKAKEICGDETNVVAQARKLYDWVIANTNHYSKPGAPKSSGLGSAQICLDQKGGGCTDQHALFIAMARARGIPARLHFGSRLTAQNENKDVNPGYRCWVSYFVPNYGWVPSDMSAGNTSPGKEGFYFSGLDERRIWFSDGRDLELNPKQDSSRVNTFIIAYVEVDGRPHTAFDRVLRFREVAEK